MLLIDVGNGGKYSAGTTDNTAICSVPFMMSPNRLNHAEKREKQDGNHRTNDSMHEKALEKDHPQVDRTHDQTEADKAVPNIATAPTVISENRNLVIKTKTVRANSKGT